MDAVVRAAYMHIQRLRGEVMMVLRCRSTTSSLTVCPAQSSSVSLYGRPGVRLDDNQLRHLVLDVRVRTRTCLPTKHLRRVALDGRSTACRKKTGLIKNTTTFLPVTSPRA